MALALAWAGFVVCAYGGATLGAGLGLMRVVAGPSAAGRDSVARTALSFVLGQGAGAALLLGLGLAGRLDRGAVWLLAALGWLALACHARTPLAAARVLARALSRGRLRPFFWRGLAYACLGLVALRGVAALAPTKVDDALAGYLVAARMTAFEGRVGWQPYAAHGGLLPLQIELHWAALFTLADETAVALWDAGGAAAALAVLFLLTLRWTRSGRAAWVAVLMLSTTPAFLLLVGACKIDNAALQFGVAVFLWPALRGVAPWRRALASGLCLGWLLLARPTAVFVLPAWLLLLARGRLPRPEARPRLVGAALAGMAVAAGPWLLEHALLVGAPWGPLARAVGRVGSEAVSGMTNLSWLDVALHPWIWTFAGRPHMLGNVSCLFLGLAPLAFLLRDRPELRRARPALGLGLFALATWLVLRPRVLQTRWLLPALALVAVGLAPALPAALDSATARTRRVLQAVTALLAAFWLAVGVYGALEGSAYVAGRVPRDARYARKPGIDAARWINAHVTPGEGVDLGPLQAAYALRPEILAHARAATWADSPLVRPAPLGCCYVVVRRGTRWDDCTAAFAGVAFDVLDCRAMPAGRAAPRTCAP